MDKPWLNEEEERLIPSAMRRAFDALLRGNPHMALIACEVNGKPSVAIACLAPNEEGEPTVRPLFVALTEDIDCGPLPDKEGATPTYQPQTDAPNGVPALYDPRHMN